MAALSVIKGMSERYLKTFDRKNKTIERRIVEKGTREENVIGRKMVEGTVGRYNNKLKTEWNENSTRSNSIVEGQSMSVKLGICKFDVILTVHRR